MPWYCQMLGLLECEDNWSQQGYLGSAENKTHFNSISNKHDLSLYFSRVFSKY